MLKIPENVVVVFKTVFPLVIIIILFIVVGEFGFGKIGEIRAQVSAAQINQKILTQKLDILKNISGTGAASSNIVASALPSSNPALSVISQLKILAGNSSLVLSELKAGTPTADPQGYSTVSLTFTIVGSRLQVESFLNSTTSFAPLTIVDKIKLSEISSGSAMANISVKSFYAPFPTKIPAITDALSDLTAAEQATLKSVSSLTQPTFSALPAPVAGGKSDPFSP